MKKIVTLAMIALAASVAPAAPPAEQRVEASREVIRNLEEQTFGVVQEDALWVDSFGKPRKTLTVCWHDATPDNERLRVLVRQSVEDTWQRHSSLEFIGWQPCSQSPSNIKIAVGDVNPHTKGLGNRLDNVKEGMVLNFHFNAWSPSCRQNQTQLDLCVRSISVHEFGHAIGFAHEHNRDDREASCLERPQGTSGDVALTPYDPDSVMNYCNPKYNNFGKLSPYDVISVQSVYGVPQ